MGHSLSPRVLTPAPDTKCPTFRASQNTKKSHSSVSLLNKIACHPTGARDCSNHNKMASFPLAFPLFIETWVNFPGLDSLTAYEDVENNGPCFIMACYAYSWSLATIVYSVIKRALFLTGTI